MPCGGSACMPKAPQAVPTTRVTEQNQRVCLSRPHSVDLQHPHSLAASMVGLHCMPCSFLPGLSCSQEYICIFSYIYFSVLGQFGFCFIMLGSSSINITFEFVTSLVFGDPKGAEFHFPVHFRITPGLESIAGVITGSGEQT